MEPAGCRVTPLPSTNDAASQYVTNTDYTAYGDASLVSLQTTGGSFVQRGLTYDDATRRLTDAKTIRRTGPQAVDDTTYAYDAAGDVTRIGDTGATGGTDTQCFGYDCARRLTDAWTPGTGDCGAAKSAATLGGPAPYWQSWTFDAAGNRKTPTTVRSGTPSPPIPTPTRPPVPAASGRTRSARSAWPHRAGPRPAATGTTRWATPPPAPGRSPPRRSPGTLRATSAR